MLVMNNKFLFDLDNVDSNLFADTLSSFTFARNVIYSVDISIVSNKDDVYNHSVVRFPFKSSYKIDSFVRLKTIPFHLTSKEDVKDKLKSLFIDIFVSVSYTDVGEYCVYGVCYNRAFCVSINKSRF